METKVPLVCSQNLQRPPPQPFQHYRYANENCALLGLYGAMGPIGCPETSLRNYHYLLVIAQKSTVLIYFSAEACNHVRHKIHNILTSKVSRLLLWAS
jgi:hypothetical protein